MGNGVSRLFGVGYDGYVTFVDVFLNFMKGGCFTLGVF